MFSCTLCVKTFKCSPNLNVHMLSHTKEKPHKCHVCAKTFGLEGNLKKHVKSVHDGIKEIKKRNTQCPLCSYKCYSKTYLERHMRKHSAEQPFSCDKPSCGFKTKYKIALVRHVRIIHNDEKTYECPSDGCNYQGKTRDHLKSHLKFHSNEKPFACNVPGCDYSSKTKGCLKVHTARIHSDEKPFKCSICDFRAKVKCDLKEHQRSHMTTKHFHCQVPNCGFSTHLKNQVERHFDAKHRKKGIRCTEPGCNSVCGSMTLLKLHRKGHELPMLKCPGDSCNYSTKIKSSLANHISRFHEDIRSATVMQPSKFNPEIAGMARAMETLHCCFPDCNYQTKVPHHYDRHRTTHNKDERCKHVCPFCFSRFGLASQLNVHFRSHTQEKPYSCPYCKYSTADAFQLRKHSRRSHHIHVIPRGKEDGVRKCLTCGRNCFSYSEFVLHSMNHLMPVVVLERLRVHTV